MQNKRPERREVLAAMATAGAALALPGPFGGLLALPGKKRFRITACDWSIGRIGKITSLELAAKIGLDGVQVSFDRPGKYEDLRNPEMRRKYRDAAKKQGVEIASLAMGVLNNVPYSSSPEAERWVEECVDVLPKMGLKVVLLAFFARGDIKGKPELQKEVIRRLKKVAPRAEKAGVILGLETWLSAEEHLRILDGVGSPAVKVYYDVANSEKRGYDIYKEIRRLGRDRICEIHMKENGSLLGQGRIDFRKVREAIDDAGYRGWLVIESATVKGKSLFECYVHNRKYLRKLFPG